MTTTFALEIHGHPLVVRADDTLAETVRGLLGGFAPSAAEPAAATVELRVGPPPEEPSLAPLRTGHAPNGPVRFLLGEGQRRAVFDGVGAVTIAGTHARVDLGPQRSLFDDSLLTFGVSEVLATHGLYTLHGAALAVDDAAVLVCGHSGAGKSTCALALVAGGFDHLTDDFPAWRVDAAGAAEVLTWPMAFKVTPGTAGFFPELGALDYAPETGKAAVYPQDIWPSRPIERARPRILVLPEIEDRETSALVPLGPAETMDQLLPHALVPFDPALTRARFDALAHLVRGLRGYRLRFGRDVRAVAPLIRDLLRQP